MQVGATACRGNACWPGTGTGSLRMVDVRMDRRLAARLDPSDVVQEILIDANQNLDDFLKQQADTVLCLAPSACLGAAR